MRCNELTNSTIEAIHHDYFQTSSEVAQDETTEQVFSRKDRKAYRAEVLGKRTAEAKRTVTERQTCPLGEEKQTRSKAKH